ncbi:MAG: FAD-dependent oxidoreductase, partial [Balneolaceae bacterium]
MTVQKSDYLIIGSGVAGLNAALEAAQYGEVLLVTKSTLNESSSYWAQGGVAAVLDESDSYENHSKDTLEAGRGYCNPEAVEILVKEGADRIKELINMGMPFERENGHLQLGMEGGHSNRRILHANGAATGKAMVDFLISRIQESDRITIAENVFVYDLISEENRCLGALAYLYKDDKIIQIQSRVTLLATGGYSGLYTRTTNPHTSTGDGLWLALNHGAVVKDLEFIQFHPTVYVNPKGEGFLLSEALRGEGARLFNSKGERFMEKYPDRELSPRDVVSREIFNQISHQQKKYVYLDLTHLNFSKIRTRFPGLIRRIEMQGIDITKQGIPVVPAAHYCIGGVETGLEGETNVEALYACGEVAATGVHGANRLASNSL